MRQRIYADRVLTSSEKVNRSIRNAIARGQCGGCYQKRDTERSKRYCLRCLEKCLIKTKKRRAAVWQQVLDHYGHECNCCKEANPLFLTLDHKNNDGFLDKKLGPNILYKVIRENFPDTYQILCYNCNCGKARNHGACPHKEGVRS